MSESMTEQIYNVLFLCTGNTARSILAEGILRKDGKGRFRAFSAGSQPKGVVNPFALKVLDACGYPAEGYRSKSWQEFAASDAPRMDFVFTVCDSAAGEACPVWPGQPMTAHWSIEDPAAVEGSDIDKERAFTQAFKILKNRISLFAALPVASLDRASLHRKLVEIGQSEDASSARNSAGHNGIIDVILYHNPECGTSRNVLAMIRNAGIEPHIIEYVKTPPSRAMLVQLIKRMGLPVRALLREKGTPYAELNLADPTLTDDQLLDAMVAHPILINRPIVVSNNRVKLCRPSEQVLDLLPPQRAEFIKEDGERVIDKRSRPVKTA